LTSGVQLTIDIGRPPTFCVVPGRVDVERDAAEPPSIRRHRLPEAPVTTDFQPKRDTSLRITVQLATDAVPAEGASPRSAFWNTLHADRSNGPPSPEETLDARATHHENAFKRNFGEGLRNGLFRNRDARDSEPRRRGQTEGADGGITFWLSVGQVGYGSLSFGLVVTGAPTFLKFFDDDVDLCRAVLASLVPESLVWASADGKYNSNEEALDRIGSVEVDVSLLNAFVPAPLPAPPATPPEPKKAFLPTPLPAPPAPPPEPKPDLARTTRESAVKKGSPAEEDRFVFWRGVMSATLLVPVLLALGVLYAAFTFLRDERASLRDERDAVTRRMDDALSHERSALKEERAAMDARLEREVDREVERASFWAQLGEDLSKPSGRPVEPKKFAQPAVVGAVTATAAAEPKAAAAAHP
jgi:hypothetical protein